MSALEKALRAIDYSKLTDEFLAHPLAKEIVTGCAQKISLWSNALRDADPSCLANPFLAEMQRACHDIAALFALALYVPSAAAMRSMAETCLYYTYYRTHSVELVTLASGSDHYISKKEMLEFHKIHTPTYRSHAHAIGIPSKFNDWYSELSSIVHGQLPGKWGKRLSLADTKHSVNTLDDALKKLQDGVEAIHLLLCLTAGNDLWSRFHPKVKTALLKGMKAEHRGLLGLDGA